MEIRLSEIAGIIGAVIPKGTEDVILRGVAPLEHAGEGDVTFLSEDKYAGKLPVCRASVILVRENVDVPASLIPLVVREPYYEFIKLIRRFSPRSHADIAEGISPGAYIDDTAELGRDVSLGPFACIGKHVRIGDGTVIGPGTVVLSRSVIGSRCLLYPNVTVMDRCTVGNGVIIHSGAVIGADGFGLSCEPAREGEVQCGDR